MINIRTKYNCQTCIINIKDKQFKKYLRRSQNLFLNQNLNHKLKVVLKTQKQRKKLYLKRKVHLDRTLLSKNHQKKSKILSQIQNGLIKKVKNQRVKQLKNHVVLNQIMTRNLLINQAPKKVNLSLNLNQNLTLIQILVLALVLALAQNLVQAQVLTQIVKQNLKKKVLSHMILSQKNPSIPMITHQNRNLKCMSISHCIIYHL